MDAGEDLARLVDAARGAGPHLVDRAPPRSVNAGQAEEGSAHRPPVALGRDPLDAARLTGTGRRRLVDPAAAVIAVHARRREVAQPALAQQRRTGPQHRVPGGTGPDGAEDWR